MGASFVTLLVAGSMAGFVLAGRLPTIVSAALLLMTPLYFITSMLAGVKRATDVLPVVFGALLGPLLFRALPGFDLAVTGLLGGTAAWAIERRLRR